MIEFNAELKQAEGKNATGIEVPPEILERLGAGKRPRLRVTINGHGYQSSRRHAYVSWIEQAKRAETRQERVRRTAELLAQRQPQR